MKQLLLILKNSTWRTIVFALIKGDKGMRELSSIISDQEELKKELEELVSMQVLSREAGFGEMRYGLSTHFKKKCARTVLPLIFSLLFSVTASLLQLEKHRFHKKQTERIYNHLYD